MRRGISHWAWGNISASLIVISLMLFRFYGSGSFNRWINEFTGNDSTLLEMLILLLVGSLLLNIVFQGFYGKSPQRQLLVVIQAIFLGFWLFTLM